MSDLTEAKALVRNMKAKFQAWERLEVAIGTIEQAANLEKEKEVALAALDTRLNEKTAAFNELTNTLNNLKDRFDNMNSSYQRKSDELSSAYETQRKTAASMAKEAQREHELRTAAFSEEIETLTGNKKALEDAIASLQGKLQAIRASISI